MDVEAVAEEFVLLLATDRGRERKRRRETHEVCDLTWREITQLDQKSKREHEIKIKTTHIQVEQRTRNRRWPRSLRVLCTGGEDCSVDTVHVILVVRVVVLQYRPRALGVVVVR